MKFKNAFTIVLFIIFATLCGFETINNIKTSAQRDISSVRYTSAIKGTSSKKEKPKKDFDLDQILQHTNLDG